MRYRRVNAFALLVGLNCFIPCVAAEASRLEHGRQVYQREGCPMCHSIAGKGNRRNPLDGVGSRLNPEQIRKWIASPQEVKPGVKKKSYDLSEPDLTALIEYLQSLTE